MHHFPQGVLYPVSGTPCLLQKCHLFVPKMPPVVTTVRSAKGANGVSGSPSLQISCSVYLLCSCTALCFALSTLCVGMSNKMQCQSTIAASSTDFLMLMAFPPGESSHSSLTAASFPTQLLLVICWMARVNPKPCILLSLTWSSCPSSDKLRLWEQRDEERMQSRAAGLLCCYYTCRGLSMQPLTCPYRNPITHGCRPEDSQM